MDTFKLEAAAVATLAAAGVTCVALADEA